jgi:DNA-directed RNA polymerase specialized sigma subunit
MYERNVGKGEGTLNQQTLTEEECRTVLRRLAWRIQYQARKYRQRECLGAERVVALVSTDQDMSALYVREMLAAISSDKGRWIVQRVILHGYPEREVARELAMSQQGVNKCKTKALQQLRTRLQHLNG